MKSFRFHPAAASEMNDAAAFYEAKQKDLGKRFLASVQEALQRISITPDAYRPVCGDVRRCLVKTFPYAVLFRELPSQLVVIAVMHLHREPSYWNQRRT